MIDAYSPGVENKHTVFDEDDSDGSLLGIGSIEESHKMLNEFKIPLLKQGIIGGMTGVMMGESRRRSVNSIAMLAEASGEFGNGTIPDSRAAARIIKIREMMASQLNPGAEPLMVEAQRIEEQIREMMASQLNPGAEPLMVEAQRIEEQIREMMASQLNPSAEKATNEASNMYG
jgi:predicted ATP-grasp superfamily ATP-dependent carboligase